MSSFDITRIAGAAPLRDTGANLPPRARSLTSEMGGGAQIGGKPSSGVSVETAAPATAGQPPVDADRVAEIKQALQQGDYPLNPAKIADAIIAARLMLSTGR